MSRPAKDARTWGCAAAAYEASPACQGLRSKVDVTLQLAWLSARLSGRPLLSLDRGTIVRTLDAKLAEGVSEATLNRYAATIARVLKYSVERGWIDSLPVMPRFRERARKERFLSPQEAAALLDALPGYLRPLVQFSLATGLRQANVTHLEWSRINLDGKHAYIEAESAKSGRAIGIPLSDEAMRVLLEQHGKSPKWVFPVNGKPLERPAREAWQRALKVAGIENFRWHDLRHTWASRHAMAGTPPMILQKLGGWSSLALVERYSHLSPDHCAQYANNSSQ